MPINNEIFKELIKRGYSKKKDFRVWDISDSKLWYLTPELAKGFLNLKKYNPYRARVIDDELELIKQHSKNIIQKLGNKKFNLIDLGCGNGIKAEAFIKSIPNDVLLRYCPVDISEYYIDSTKEKIRSIGSSKISAIKPFVIDFRELDKVVGILRNGEYQKNIYLLLGETISHYDIHDLLYKISQNMLIGDYIIIGNGIRKGKRFVNLDKYKNPLFNEWFIHIMEGLGFSSDEVKVNVRFTNERLEGYYSILKDKSIDYKGKKVGFKEGDEVIVAIQYKFFENELKKYCKMYFSEVEILKNSDEEYCLAVCRK